MKQWTTAAGSHVIKITGGRSNVFLISRQGINVLVDTSPGFMGNRLLKKLRKHLNSNPEYLFLTHTHFDHAANAHLIKALYSTKIVVHIAESGFLLSGDSPLPAGTNVFTSWLVRNFGKAAAGKVKYHGVSPDLMIGRETNLSIHGMNIGILPTAGHTAGSISLIIDHELALVGDTLFGVFPGHCFPPFADNTGELMNSWQLLLNTGCRIFLPSHGSARTYQVLERCLKYQQSRISR
ncbi:MAG: MBL fold metallo-hydrolase [Bacteroidales bacterium]|nr:MBL fold metallo-hydrolase [Bacteroidales bacterium]